MIVRLSYIDHLCADKNCKGEVLSTQGNVQLIRHAILIVPGLKIPKAFDSTDDARGWAERNGHTVEDAA